MNLEEARKVILDNQAGAAGWAIAAATIEIETRQEPLAPPTLEDLLRCVQRGGLAASTAFCALHGRTGRPWDNGSLYGVKLDPDKWEEIYATKSNEWREYLKIHGFLT